jgi:hypothetical protein
MNEAVFVNGPVVSAGVPVHVIVRSTFVWIAPVGVAVNVTVEFSARFAVFDTLKAIAFEPADVSVAEGIPA